MKPAPSPAERCVSGCGCEDGKGAAHEGPCVMEPSPAERMSDERFRIAEASDPACPMHTELYAEARRARAEEARLDADIERSAESRNRLIDDYEAKLKEAEEGDVQRVRDITKFATERDHARERVAELEAALRKAEEENERLTRARSHHLVRADVAENTLEDVWKALGYADGEPPGYPYSLAEIVHERDFAAMRMIEQRDAAEAEVERVTKLHNECHDAIEEGQAREAELRKIIENAPHGCNCKSNLMKYWDEENNCQHPCDCWKAAALRSLRGEK
jgi:hypothetical protein